QLSAFDPLPHVIQQGAQIVVALTFDKQFQRIQDGQAGMNQGQKLLVEDDEFALFYLTANSKLDLSTGKQAARLDRVNQKPLLRIALPDLSLGVPVLHLL